ncbi:MAG: hypothetical protein Edafosvirus7_7 [Edafosvirus sp.]|uniref:Uncharacterized protein n=1 Tax=Edafosvirus sp. TaxID=2487765 RepID=A0A3G4ZTI9_9VIRU|nr:MAG: hypothetical protein Edafosvirus7_7 [Edafosvirus sp.]
MIGAKVVRSLARNVGFLTKSKPFVVARRVATSVKPRTMMATTLATMGVTASTLAGTSTTPTVKKTHYEGKGYLKACDRCNKEFYPNICKDILNQVFDTKDFIESKEHYGNSEVAMTTVELQQKVQDVEKEIKQNTFNKCFSLNKNVDQCNQLIYRALAISAYGLGESTAEIDGLKISMEVTDIDKLTAAISTGQYLQSVLLSFPFSPL